MLGNELSFSTGAIVEKIYIKFFESLEFEKIFLFFKRIFDVEFFNRGCCQIQQTPSPLIL